MSQRYKFSCSVRAKYQRLLKPGLKVEEVPNAIAIIPIEMMLDTIEKIASELESSGYKVAFVHTGSAKQAINAALSNDRNTLPAITIFLPNARLVPPEPATSLIIDWETSMDAQGEKMVEDIRVTYDNPELETIADEIAEQIFIAL